MEVLEFREERKHFFNRLDYYPLVARLRAVMTADPYTDETGHYLIHSYYFDNLDSKAYFEKENGRPRREKFRIRYYNQDTSIIKLEKKSKIYGKCNKQSTTLTKEQCIALINKDFEWLRDEDDQLLVELYAKMKYQGIFPSTISTYLREPYIYKPGNVRVTIDTQMRTGIFSKAFFEPSYPFIPSIDPNIFLLEVKYDEFLPNIIRDIVQMENRMWTGFSKYGASRRYG